MTTTPMHLPESLQYPIVITSIVAKPSSTIKRGTTLIHYSFEFTPRRSFSPDPADKAPLPKPERRFSSWDSPSNGVVKEWHIRPGQRITLNDAKDAPALTLFEECPHSMQIAGLCTRCGEDMTITDYIGITDEARAGIRMTHDAAGPTVSIGEARRIEKETAEKLRDARKLILIVDLDQTIVHATVDPTVGEWISQGKTYENRLAEKATAKATKGVVPKKKDVDEDDDADSDNEEEIEVNPNWEVLKDVAQFKLAPDAPIRRGRPAVREEPCDYYIKPRPGLSTFLTALKEKYEMHVYTMGTRAYALQVCNIIDPNGSYFGGRILSRDDSGSLTMKHIQRLFPYNSSMVVIIDDRADVWRHSPNLVKVVPYDFFIGIGDINATFLPKSPDPVGNVGETTPVNALSSVPLIPPSNESPDSAVPALAASPHTASPAPPSTDIDMTKGEVEAAIIAEAQSKAVNSQLEERPLAKMQKELDKEEEKGDSGTQSTNGQPNGENEKNGRENHNHHHKGKALLSNNDWELERVWNILLEVHRRYYEAQDASRAKFVDIQGKGKQKGSLAKNNKVPDVAVIIPAIKAEVLAGVRILFSSVIPLNTPPEQSEAWRCARDFGAKCSTKLTAEVTHVVSAKEGTHKVLEAFHKGNIKVVWTKWFNDCIALWKHLEEKGDYLLPSPSKRTLESLDAAATPGSNAGNEVNGKQGEGYSQAAPVVDETASPGTDTGTPVGTPRMVELDLDWQAAQDELDAFLAETDDEGGGGDDEKGDGDDEDEQGDEEEGPDREGRDGEFGERDLDEMLADEEAMDISYGEPSSSKSVLKRPRSSTPNSTASDSEDDATPSAKRTKLAPGPSNLNNAVAPDEETDEDEEMTGSKPGSLLAPGGEVEEDDDDEDEEDEDGSSAAEGFGDSASEDGSDDSDDDDFLNELSAASDGPG